PMPEMIKTGEGPEKDVISFWGRIKDSRGNYVEGALVLLTALTENGNECLGHTYSSRQGFYMISVGPDNLIPLAGNFRVAAAMGIPPAVSGNAAGRYSLYPPAGQRPPVLDFQVINYQRLKLVVPGLRPDYYIDSIPETVRVSCLKVNHSDVSVYGLSGRGYIASGESRGQGMFKITVCAMGDGLHQQEIIRVRIVPEDRTQKNLYYDSGATVTDSFY
ncbi:MAG: hypothetical protein ACYDEQ_07995, partial [Desulfocucumaceae bacterium]